MSTDTVPLTTYRGDVNEAAKLVREFLGVRGRDDYGNRVYVHRHFDKPYEGIYVAEIVYESREWAYDFEEWLEDEGRLYRMCDCDIVVWSSYAVMIEYPHYCGTGGMIRGQA